MIGCATSRRWPMSSSVETCSSARAPRPRRAGVDAYLRFLASAKGSKSRIGAGEIDDHLFPFAIADGQRLVVGEIIDEIGVVHGYGRPAEACGLLAGEGAFEDSAVDVEGGGYLLAGFDAFHALDQDRDVAGLLRPPRVDAHLDLDVGSTNRWMATQPGPMFRLIAISQSPSFAYFSKVWAEAPEAISPPATNVAARVRSCSFRSPVVDSFESSDQALDAPAAPRTNPGKENLAIPEPQGHSNCSTPRGVRRRTVLLRVASSCRRGRGQPRNAGRSPSDRRQTCESIGRSFTRLATKRRRKPVSGSSR